MMKHSIARGVWKMDSGKPGKIITIMAGLRGNDVRGIEELRSYIDTLEVESGVVYAIIANPSAEKKCVAYTEKDMDSTFSDIPTGSTDEDIRAQDILPYLRESDALIFFEYTPTPTMKKSICFTSHMQYAECIESDIVITGIEEFQPHRCIGYVGRLGKIAIQIERGVETTGSIQTSLDNLLISLGTSKPPESSPEAIAHTNTNSPIHYHMDRVFRAPSTRFSFLKNWKNLESVKMGEVIAAHGKVLVRAPYDGVIAFPHLPKTIGDEMCIFGRRVV